MGSTTGGHVGADGYLGDSDPLEALRGTLVARLRSRQPDVEEAMVAGGLGIVPEVNGKPEGMAHLRATASATVDLVVAVVEQGENWTPSLPQAVADHVRYLARNGVALDEIMRGYLGTSSVFFELLSEEIAELPEEALAYLVGMQSQHGDRLINTVSAEYESELERLDRSPSSRRLAERVERLIDGEPVDTSELPYDLELWHVGLIALGAKAELTSRSLAEKLGCQLLLVSRGTDSAWAWLGAKRPISFEEIEQVASRMNDGSASLAQGEPRRGIDGWRVTHREAQIALTIMRREPQPLLRCSDVILPAALLRDEEMSGLLLDVYLRPLEKCKDGEVLRETLRGYFAAGGNAASAAAALGVDRHTVQRRLRRVEECIGRPLNTCRAELETALRVQQLAGSSA